MTSRGEGIRGAVLDIGSNSVQLLVADVAAGEEAIERAAAECVTRLGEGLGSGEALSPAACRRTLAAVRLLTRRARALGVSRLWAVGTRAFRRAVDGQAFARRIESTIGAPVEILSEDREAELGFIGAVRGLARTDARVVSIDIGGASTEIVSGASGRAAERVSLAVGAVVLSEEFLQHDPPTPEEVGALRAALCEAVARAAPFAARHDANGPSAVFIGSGGTLVTLAAMAAALDRYRPDVVHGMTLRREALTTQVDVLARRTVAERRAIPGLDPARAPTILAGAMIAEAVLDAAGARSIMVSDHGLRHAVLQVRTAALGADAR